ncbi:hypothetical protein Ancab_017645 [Ancistrocladus abbreviatus]
MCEQRLFQGEALIIVIMELINASKYSRLMESTTRPTPAGRGSVVLLPTGDQREKFTGTAAKAASVAFVTFFHGCLSGCCIKSFYPLSSLCWKSQEAFVQNGRSNIIQYRSRNEESDCNGKVSQTGVLESVSKIKKAELWR